MILLYFYFSSFLFCFLFAFVCLFDFCYNDISLLNEFVLLVMHLKFDFSQYLRISNRRTMKTLKLKDQL